MVYPSPLICLALCLASLFMGWAPARVMAGDVQQAHAQSQTDPRRTLVEIRSAELESRQGKRIVSLPHALPGGAYEPSGSRVVYRLSVGLPGLPDEPLGLFISRLSLSGHVRVNGLEAGACAVGALELLRCLHQPQFFVPPRHLWRVGANEIEIEVFANDRQMNGLSRVVLGPAARLEQGPFAYQRFLRVEVVYALTWITVCLGALSLVVGGLMRERSVYTWFGLASIANALSNVNFLTNAVVISPEFFSWFVFTARMVSVPLLMLACVAFFQRDPGWLRASLIAYAVFAPALVWLSGNARSVVAIVYAPMLVVGVAVLAAMMLWTWQARSGPRLAMVGVTLVMLASGVHDWLRLRGDTGFEGTYLLSYATAGLLVIMGGLIMAELASGLKTAQALSRSLEHQVAEREQAIAQAYETRLDVARRLAMQDERDRLISDMHDSLGAGLSTAHLLLKQGRIRADKAADLVQECIDDLRLVFEVSANLDDNLRAILADFRHRLEPRLVAAGIETGWRFELEGLPALSSTQSLQLMRIVQEAMTNAIRHAATDRIDVSACWQPALSQLVLTVRDHGCGMPAPSETSSGRGLVNMSRRAAALGAELDVRSAAQGTTVEVRFRPARAGTPDGGRPRVV